jgi:cobyrinic acid a,c-diamide synthase
MKCIVIAAPHSGSGKTTLTLGIMRALKLRGLRVAPFKVGPDFIDPGYHELVTGTPSANLDGWMCGLEFVRATFRHHAAGADLALVEGVMGLFDGMDGVSEAGSSAEIAKTLGAPVLLVVDARSQARSAAALVHGFASFDPGLNLAGVIFNNVGSENHEAILREAVAAGCPGVAVIGCLPRDPLLAIPSRHLGLTTAQDNPLSAEYLTHLAEVMEEHLDLDRLLELAGSAPQDGAGQLGGSPIPLLSSPLKGEGPVVADSPAPAAVLPPGAAVRVAVARDAAFCFAYPDNLRLLSEQGAELVFFSPLAGDRLPHGIAGLYLPGGYPELYAEQLAENRSLKDELRAAIEAGLPVYAECGGFIYLTRGVEADGVLHHFVGVFPVQTRMLPKRKALGYREVTLIGDCLAGSKGAVLRGHEFHYSEMAEMPADVERVYRVSRKGIPLGLEGYRQYNCLASYIHLHFGSCPDFAGSFVMQCSNYQSRSKV